MYQEEQWLEQVDMSLTDKQSRALGWDQRSVLVEMFSFLCIALVSCLYIGVYRRRSS